MKRLLILLTSFILAIPLVFAPTSASAHWIVDKPDSWDDCWSGGWRMTRSVEWGHYYDSGGNRFVQIARVNARAPGAMYWRVWVGNSNSVKTYDTGVRYNPYGTAWTGDIPNPYAGGRSPVMVYVAEKRPGHGWCTMRSSSYGFAH